MRYAAKTASATMTTNGAIAPSTASAQETVTRNACQPALAPPVRPGADGFALWCTTGLALGPRTVTVTVA